MNHGRKISIRLVAATALTLIGATAASGPASAAATACQTTVAASGLYSVKVCLTMPVSGATLTGDTTVTGTVDVVAGTSPGVRKTQWSLNGNYLLTDYSSPHQFVLPTADFADGSYTIGVAAAMRDLYTTPETTVTVNLSNGNVVAPPNTRQWTVPTIHQRGPSEPFVVGAVGDGAGGEPAATAVTNAIVGWQPDLFLYLGDVYEKGTLTEFKNWYGGSTDWYGQLRPITTPVVGNHEYAGNQAPGYFNYWDNIGHYYSYDANGWHFIAIDSTSNYNNVAPGQAQYQWLAADLAANRSPCTVVFWHHPLYTIGSEAPAPRMQPMWDLMASYHVTLNLTGHDHQYQRWSPMGAGGVLDPSGITQLVIGGGGHSSQGMTSADPRAAVTNKSYGAERLELYGDHADLRYYAASATASTLVDSTTVTCKGPDGIAPSAPGGLTVTTNQASSVALAWTPATDNFGVTGYRVYRDGAQIADLGPAATTWVDSSVAAATHYQYTADAVDAAGNRSATTAALQLTTPGSDNTAPSAPANLVGHSGGGAIALSWDAASDNVAVTGYQLRRDGALIASVTGLSYVDLPPGPAGATHSYQVLAGDAAGNLSAPSNTVSLSTADTTAPTAPTGLSVTATGPNQASLSWAASTDDTAVAGYLVYRDGSLIANTSGLSVLDSGLLSETSYSYVVSAYDTAGNFSLASPSAIVTTPTGAAIVASADGYTKSTSPTSKYGSATALRVDGSPTTNSYLKFTVTGLTSGLQRARLRVYVAAGATAGFEAHGVADTSWTESLLTWATAPAIDSTAIASTGRTVTGTWVTVDITSLINGNGTYSIALISSGASSSAYGSRESGTPPVLLLDPLP